LGAWTIMGKREILRGYQDEDQKKPGYPNLDCG